MTPEKLETLIFNNDREDLFVSAVSQLSEKERKTLSTHTNKLRNQITSGKAKADASKLVKRSIEKHSANYWGTQAYSNVQLAVLAFCPLSTVKRAIDFFSWRDNSAAFQIILDRKPAWLDDWLAFNLDQEFANVPFELVRGWMKEGICNKPTVEGYTRQFAWNLMAINHRKDQAPNKPISERLINEPDMIDDIWRLFEVENQAFNTESWLTNNAPANYETWPEALTKLADKGIIDRAKLLDASLQGLSNDLKQNQLSGFHKFHEQLAPTKTERSQRRAEYMALLFHKTGHVLKFSLKMLSQLERDKSLELTKFLIDVAAVFAHEAKGNAITALKLIARILKKEKDRVPCALPTMAEALRHPNADVQALAIELLTTYNEQMSDDFKSELLITADFVADANKPLLMSLLGKTNNTLGTISELNKVDSSVLSRQLSELSVLQRETLGLGNIDLEDDLKGDIQPLKPEIIKDKHFHMPDLLEPITEFDELIQALSHAVEIIDEPEDVERILDGISRLCGEYPREFDKKTSPLLKRINDGGSFETMKGLLGFGGGLLLSITDLVLTWLTGEFYQSKDTSYFSRTPSLDPMIVKVNNIKRRVYAKKPQQLLSFPTHKGGWIDPVTWVNRLNIAFANDAEFDRMDFNHSMLRLMPYGRKTALQLVRNLPENIETVVKFVLGESLTPEYKDRRDYDLWISACRSLDPNQDWSSYLSPLKLNDNYPNSIKPAYYEWNALTKVERGYKFPGLKVTAFAQSLIEPDADIQKNKTGFLSSLGRKLTGEVTVDRKLIPSAGFNATEKLKYIWSCDLGCLWINQWLSTLWPTNPDAFYVLAVTQQISRIDMDSSSFEPNFGFLSGLFEPNRVWSELAHLTLFLGLVGKDSDSRALAVDAFIEAVDNDLASQEIMAGILVKLTQAGWLKFNRLAEGLKQVTQVSATHRYFVSRMLQIWLPQIDLKLRNIHLVLEVLLDVQTALNQKVSTHVSESLKDLKGKTKAAITASRIVKAGSEASEIVRQIKLNLIASRLALVEVTEAQVRC
ncbi:DUF6493 family protein [Aliikangiella marina]|nr:DUF6493 family protein [Aliikangiella marina]